MFTSPRSAVDAAVAAQRALELPVRMGIATGEAELRGDDYFGTVLNRTARVMAAGHGGQILLDGTTAALLSGVELIAIGAEAATRHRQTGRRVPSPGRRSAHRLPTAEDGRCHTGQPAAADHQLRRARGGTDRVGDGAQGAPVGDADRCRRGRQDPARAGGRRRSANDFPDGVWVIELAAGRRSRPRCPKPSRPCSASPSSRA